MLPPLKPIWKQSRLVILIMYCTFKQSSDCIWKKKSLTKNIVKNIFLKGKVSFLC